MFLRSRRQPIRPKYAFATSQGVTIEKQTIIVEFEHEGVVGLGEIAPSTTYGQTLESSEEVVACADELIVEDPFAIESIVAALIGAFDGQRAAIGGIESALYDWAGKRLGAPVYRLLGLPRPEVATTLTIGVAEAAEIAEKVEAAVRDGFKLLKVKVGTEHDERTLAIVRERFGGPLLLDANQAWSPDDAPARIAELAAFRAHWIEEPILAEEPIDTWRALARASAVPLAAGENLRGAEAFRAAIDAGFLAFVQPDVGKWGGISGGLEVARHAASRGVALCPHWLAGGIGLAASMHLTAAAGSAGSVVEVDANPNPLRERVFPLQIRDGIATLSNAPGLGIEPDLAALEPFAVA